MAQGLGFTVWATGNQKEPMLNELKSTKLVNKEILLGLLTMISPYWLSNTSRANWIKNSYLQYFSHIWMDLSIRRATSRQQCATKRTIQETALELKETMFMKHSKVCLFPGTMEHRPAVESLKLLGENLRS